LRPITAAEQWACEAGGGHAIFDPELLEDALEVLAHRVHADPKDPADFAIGLALAKPVQHFAFARSEQGEEGFRFSALHNAAGAATPAWR
jgi:hypothetical protein